MMSKYEKHLNILYTNLYGFILSLTLKFARRVMPIWVIPIVLKSPLLRQIGKKAEHFRYLLLAVGSAYKICSVTK